MMDCENIQSFCVDKLPNTVYYIPEFITKGEEEHLLQQVDAAPKPKWTQLSHRRLQNWGGLPHPKGMVAETIPEWLNRCIEKIHKLGIFGEKVPNHVLVNEYLPGQGIMPHEDGPLYHPVVSNLTLGSHTVLDLYSPMDKKSGEGQNHGDCPGQPMHSDMETTSQAVTDERRIGGMLLQRRSLFLMCEDMYRSYLHGIREIDSDLISDSIVNLDRCSDVTIGDTLQRDRRVSLTIRHVPKVLKNKLFFGNKKR